MSEPIFATASKYQHQDDHREDRHGDTGADRLRDAGQRTCGFFRPSGEEQSNGGNGEQPQALVGYKGGDRVRPGDRRRGHGAGIDEDMRSHGREREHDELGQRDGDIHKLPHPDAPRGGGQSRDPLDKRRGLA